MNFSFSPLIVFFSQAQIEQFSKRFIKMRKWGTTTKVEGGGGFGGSTRTEECGDSLGAQRGKGD